MSLQRSSHVYEGSVCAEERCAARSPAYKHCSNRFKLTMTGRYHVDSTLQAIRHKKKSVNIIDLTRAELFRVGSRKWKVSENSSSRNPLRSQFIEKRPWPAVEKRHNAENRIWRTDVLPVNVDTSRVHRSKLVIQNSVTIPFARAQHITAASYFVNAKMTQSTRYHIVLNGLWMRLKTIPFPVGSNNMNAK